MAWARWTGAAGVPYAVHEPARYDLNPGVACLIVCIIVRVPADPRRSWGVLGCPSVLAPPMVLDVRADCPVPSLCDLQNALCISARKLAHSTFSNLLAQLLDVVGAVLSVCSARYCGLLQRLERTVRSLAKNWQA